MGTSDYYADSLLGEYYSNAVAEDITVPQIAVSSADGVTTSTHQPFISLRPVSVISLVSTCNTLYSSAHSEEGIDLQSVRLQLDQIDTKPSPLSRFKRFITKPEPEKEENDDAKFMSYVRGKLSNKYYAYEKTTTLIVEWADAAETFFFGDTLASLFTDQALLHYLVQSSLELGEPKFSNLTRFHENVPPYDLQKLMQQLEPELERFGSILDLYAESEDNIKRPELFELFSGFANHCDGLSIPLAIAMFGNWLLTYNRDKAIANNYQNELILNYFRKAARLALVVRKLCPQKSDDLGMSKYFGKDNQLALGLSLHSLGEYYQYSHDYNTAVTLWEMNGHLTGDVDSCNLAILGLTDGFGLGNHLKDRNHLGKRSKTHKFNTKRRIAQLYRTLMKRPDFHEYGVSWASKEKYD